MNRTSARGVIRRTSIILMMGLAALACVKWIQAHELLLTTVAHPVTKVNAETEHVSWFSDHQLLITTTQSDLVEKKAQQSAHPPKIWRESIDLLDTTTGRRDHLTALTDLLNRTLTAPLQASDGFTVSPDRTWLLWDTNPMMYLLPELHAAHLDGTAYRTWKNGRYSDKLFLDTRHLLLSTEEKPGIVIHDLEDPTQDRTISNPEQQKAIFAQYAAQSPVFITVNAYVGLERGANQTAQIETYRMQDHLQPPRPNTLAPIQECRPILPMNANFQAAYISPQQRYILYRLMVSRTFPLFDWLHRLFSSFDVSPTRTQELWVSRADGQGMHEIGHEPFTIVSEIAPNARIEDIQWLPDGKRICFAYDSMLYVAPVEPEK